MTIQQVPSWATAVEEAKREAAAFFEFVLENLAPSSVWHKGSKDLLLKMWRDHKAAEAELRRRFP